MTPRRRSRTFGLRRALAGCLVLGVGLLMWMVQPPASAQASTPRWTSAFDPPAISGAYFDGSSVIYSGWFAYDPTGDPGPGSPPGPPKLKIEMIHFSMSLTSGQSANPACVPTLVDYDVTDGGTTTTSSETSTSATGTPPGSVPFTFEVTPVCNGTYQVTIYAEAGDPGPDTEYDTSDPLTLTDQVLSLIPPPVASVATTLNGDRTVTINWTAPTDYAPPPDFMGYVIERGSAAAFGAIGAVYPDTFTFTDKSVPPPAGTIVYRVRAVRAGAAGPTAPAYSPSATTPTSSVEVGPGTTTTITHKPPGTTATLPTYPRPTSPPTTSIIDGPVAPGGDTDVEPGEEDPVLPDDEFASGSVDQSFSGDEQGRRGVLVPAATFLVLAVWSMHFRYFSKAAARMALPVGPVVDSPASDFFA